MIDSKAGLPTLRQLLAAHGYWRRRGMIVDVVVINSQQTSYLRELHDEIVAAVYTVAGAGALDQSGGVFVRRRDQLAADDLLMLRATARVHIPCDGRSLGRLLEAIETPDALETRRRGKPVAPAGDLAAMGAPTLHAPAAAHHRAARTGSRHVRQRLRGPHRRGRLSHPRRTGEGAPGAVDQRDRQSARWLRRERARCRLHLGGEQLLHATHALAQRPRERSRRRRRSTSATTKPARSGARRRRRSATRPSLPSGTPPARPRSNRVRRDLPPGSRSAWHPRSR